MAVGKSIQDFAVGVSLVFDKTGYNAAESAIGKLGRDLRNFSLTVAGAAGSLFGLAAASGSHSRELKNTSSQLGITTDKLQELGYAAKVTANVTQEELVSNLDGLSHTLFESRNRTSDASRTLLNLGVKIETLNNPLTTSNELLGEVADIFKTMPDGIQKTAYANEVFGASGAKLIPFLNQGSEGMAKLSAEAHSMGIVLSKGFIEQGAAYERRMTKVWFVLKNITYVIGGQLMKYLLPLVDTFQKWITQNQKLISMDIAVGLQAIGDVLKAMGRGALATIEFIKELAKSMGGAAAYGKILGAAFIAFLFSISPLTTGLMILGAEIQDVWTYFQGGESYTGDIIAAFKRLHATISNFWIFRKIGDLVFYVFEKIDQLTTGLGKFFGMVGSMKDVGSMFSNFGKMVKDTWTDDMSRFGNLLMTGPDAYKGALGGPNTDTKSGPGFSMAGMLPALSQGSIGLQGLRDMGSQAYVSGGGGGGPSINMQNQLTFHMAPGTSAADAGRYVSDGVEKGMAQSLRGLTNQKAPKKIN